MDRLNALLVFNARSAFLLRLETNLFPVILLDTPGFAKVCKRVRKCPARWAREFFLGNPAPSWLSHALVGRGRNPDWNAPVLVWSFHVRSGDLLFRDARRRPYGRAQQGHRAQQLSVVIPS
jgi:hypothetical protein